jgi:predicted TIM-barrel fold metal-dependent hydrolase
MIIDTHQHVFWHGRDDAGLVADMDEHAIDVAWLLSWIVHPDEDNDCYHGVLNPVHIRPDGTHAGIPLQDLITARNRYPNRFVLGYCPHPLMGDASALFEVAYHTHGVRVCGEWKFRLLFDDPRCINLFRKAGELGCPVVLHIDIPYIPDGTGSMCYDRKWYGGTIDNLERALKECPRTDFIGHAPGFWREISGDAKASPDQYPQGLVTPGGRLYRLFDTYPNLFADISAGSGLGMLQRDLDHARRFVNQFSDRLLFGRDQYGGDHQKFLNTLGLQKDVLDRLFRANALKLVPSAELGVTAS